jgi:hypothetical protein
MEVEVFGVPRTLAGTVLRRVVGPSRRWSVGKLAERIDRRAGVRPGMNLEVNETLGLEFGAVGRDGNDRSGGSSRREEPEQAREPCGPFAELDHARVPLVGSHLESVDVVGNDPDP